MPEDSKNPLKVTVKIITGAAISGGIIILSSFFLYFLFSADA
jgi:hypothetical protein